MANFLFIAICLGIGALLNRYPEYRRIGPSLLNSLIFNLFLPALILAFIPKLGNNYSYEAVLLPALMPWMMFLMAWAFISLLGKTLSWSSKTQGALILVAGLGNTSFVGFPFLEALYGAASLSTGIIIDQLGSFLILSTLATVVAALYSQENHTHHSLLKKLILYPPFVALLIALMLIPIGPNEAFTGLMQRLGALMLPMALISIGFQLKISLSEIKQYLEEICWALFFKLLLAPALMVGIYVYCLKLRGEIAQITVTEAAMAPMFSSAIVASRFNLNPELANLVILVGVLISLISVPVWFALTRWI